MTALSKLQLKQLWKAYFQPTSANFSDLIDSWADYNYTATGTSAVARPVISKLGDIVSVKDFGAVGDGVTDDTAAIQAAITYVGGLGGGTVNIPQGTYKITSTISVPFSCVHLIGAGSGSYVFPTAASATKLSWYGAAAGTMMLIGGDGGESYNSGVDQLELDGRAIANYGLIVKNIRHMHSNKLLIKDTLYAALYITNDAGFLCFRPYFKDLDIWLRSGTTNSAFGVLIDGVYTTGDGTTLGEFDRPRIQHANGDGIRFGSISDGFVFRSPFVYRAPAETGYAVRAVGAASTSIAGNCRFYDAAFVGGVYVDNPNVTLGWKIFATETNDIAPGVTLLSGPGHHLIACEGADGTLYGDWKLRGGPRDIVIRDSMAFVRHDTANAVLNTLQGNWKTGGSVGSAVGDPDSVGGATLISTGTTLNNFVFIAQGNTFGSDGIAPALDVVQIWEIIPVMITDCTGYVGLFGSTPSASAPNNFVGLTFDPSVNANYRFVCRSGGSETSITLGVAIAFAKLQFKIVLQTGWAVMYYRVQGNNSWWGYVGIITTNIPSATLMPCAYFKTNAAADKRLDIYGHTIAYRIEV